MLLSHWKQGQLLHILRFELQGEEQAAPEISSPSDAKDETSVPHLVGSAAATFGSEADIFSVSLETDNSLAALLDLTKVHQRWNCSGRCVQPSSSSEGLQHSMLHPSPLFCCIMNLVLLLRQRKLQQALVERGLPKTGNKSDLAQRLFAALEDERSVLLTEQMEASTELQRQYQEAAATSGFRHVLRSLSLSPKFGPI